MKWVSSCLLGVLTPCLLSFQFLLYLMALFPIPGESAM